MSPTYRVFADLLVVLHCVFVVFVLGGGFAVVRWPRLALLHLPAVVWAVLVEMNGWICPLTPWEQRLREAAGAGQYSGDFVARYLLPVLYPAGLTPRVQWVLAAIVIAINGVLYTLVLRRRRNGRMHA